MQALIENYLTQIENALKQGDATEHTHRPFLKTLIESLRKDITATNEPKRKGGNAPDFIVTENKIPIGFIETKDIGIPLQEAQDSEQLKRYRESFHNLILSDYLEFRWYVRGELRETICLANKKANGSLMLCYEGEKDLLRIFQDFFDTQIEIITSPQDLAERMANRAKRLEESVEKLVTEGNSKHLAALFETFKKELLPDLDAKKFADLYAQTVAYGLFTARVFTKNPPFNRQKAASELPKTNPFLRRLFQQIAGYELEDEPHVWAVDNLAKLLERADMSEILKDFGKRTRQEDAVVHFYETFLKEYDPTLRELRGIYYTPAPVVSYIVRSVDAILKKDFGLVSGLADNSKIQNQDTHKVLILDPATGTGTFLSRVIDLIYQKYMREPSVWKSYVTEHLLPRIFGFELLVAPYSIAHLKLGLQLSETGYEFKEKERLNIFLTNTLEEVDRLAQAQTGGLDFWINEEAQNAQKVKQDAPVMVVLGNPPYSGHSANTGEWINQLLRGKDAHTGASTSNYFEVDRKPLGERNPKWLNDDYVKFIRFAQWRIEQTGYGILAFITNHGYLDNPTFRGMRQALMNTFDDIYLLDLHGNASKKEKSPNGSPDKNVFDIKQGVSISIFVKKQNDTSSIPFASTKQTRVFHFDLHGLREIYEFNKAGEKQIIGGKYQYLLQNDISTTEWKQLKPQKPFYLFVPHNVNLLEEYRTAWKVTNVFPVNNVGIVTSRDAFVFDLDEKNLRKRIADFINSENEIETKRKYFSDKDKLNVEKARKSILNDKQNYEKSFIKCLYRPFDIRYLFYHDAVIERSRREVLSNMISSKNIGLIYMRQVALEDKYSHFGVSRVVVDNRAFYSNKGIMSFSPLYLYPPKRKSLFDEESGERRANFSEEFIAEFAKKLGLDFIEMENPPEIAGVPHMLGYFTPEDVSLTLMPFFIHRLIALVTPNF